VAAGAELGLLASLARPMRFERERAKSIERVSEAQLRRGLGYMHGISGCRIAILSDEDESYVQVGGSGMTCCLEWRDMKRRRHFRAFQQPPVVPWPGITQLPVSGGNVSLRQEEYFRIMQVTEAFLAFFHHQPFPEYIQWRDVTDDLVAAGCATFLDSARSA
jgi:hypothetical protein